MTDIPTGWQPGRPVITAADHQGWQAWRKARALALQRQRRHSPHYLRIDYYAYGKMAKLIRDMVERGEVACYAHAIDRFIEEWVKRKFRN
jgi:hypothetical protein